MVARFYLDIVHTDRSDLQVVPALLPRNSRVFWGREVTLEPRFWGLVLDHQGLEELEPKNRSKRAKFDQKQQFLGGFLALASLNLDGRAPVH